MRKLAVLIGISLVIATPVYAGDVGEIWGTYVGSPGGGSDILTSGSDADSSTSQSDSGLELVGDQLTLIRGCSHDQILKWDENTDDAWKCAADATSVGGGNSIYLEHAGVAVGDNASADITVDATTGLSLTCVGNACTLLADSADATTVGIVELATTAETTTGTDATRAVTPDGLEDGFDGSANIVTLGTIATGTWQGTAIADAYVPDTITIDLASTATALAANPAAATAGSVITDIAADGSVEGEVDVWTEAENTSAAYIANVSEDATPTLGGNLDSGGNDIQNLGDILFQTGATGGTMSTGTSPADKFILQVYDTSGAAYVNVLELDAGNPAHAVFNEAGADLDIRFEGTGEANALFVQGSDGAVGIANGTPSEALDVTGNIAVSGTVDGKDIATNAGMINENEVITGDWDFGGGGIEIENDPTLPGACTVGQLFLDTNATSGQQLYACEGGTFALQGDGGGSVGADHIDALTEIAQGIKTAANDTSALVVGTAGATDECAKWDANGNLVTHGGACGGSPGADSIGTSELDDNADTPSTSDFVIVDSADSASFDYVTPNAGTDITADLEEEAHASEHLADAADEIFMEALGTACTVGQVAASDGDGTVSCAASGGGGETLAQTLALGADANDVDITSIAKLEGVDVNTFIDMDTTDIITTKGNIIPSGNAADDLGTDALEFNNAFFDGTLEADAITIGGTAIGSIYEVQLVNEAGLYAVLSDVTDFVQAAEANSIDSAMYVDGSIDLEHMSSASVDSDNIVNDSILEIDLKAVDAASDEECLTYEVTTGDFEWQSCGSGGGDSISINSGAVVDPDFVSTGQVSFTDTSNTITANITDDSILEADLKAVDAASDEECLTYESTTGDFEWQTCGSGSDSNSVKEYLFSAASLEPLEAGDSIPPLSKDAGTNVDIFTRSYDDSADEGAKAQIKVPSDSDTSGTVTFRYVWYSQTATSGNVCWDTRYQNDKAEGETWDDGLTALSADADAVQGTTDLVTVTTDTETFSNLGWAVNEVLDLGVYREITCTSNMTGDAELIAYSVEIPRS